MSEALFDPQACLTAWARRYRSYYLGKRWPAAYPPVAAMYLAQRLEALRVPARLFAKQVLARQRLAPVVPLRRFGGLRFTSRIS